MEAVLNNPVVKFALQMLVIGMGLMVYSIPVLLVVEIILKLI